MKYACRVAVLSVCALWYSPSNVLGQAEFHWLPAGFEPIVVSGDGASVFGYVSDGALRPARWDPVSGVTTLAQISGRVEATNEDGSAVAVGSSGQGYWISGSTVALINAVFGGFTSVQPRALSDDGQIVIGTTASPGPTYRRWTWTEAGGIAMVMGSSEAEKLIRDASGDAQVIVGNLSSQLPPTEFSAWRLAPPGGTLQFLPTVVGGGVQTTKVEAISRDGTTIVGSIRIGTAPYFPAMWEGLPPVAAMIDMPAGTLGGAASAVSRTGDVIVGGRTFGTGVQDFEAWVWDATHGTRNLRPLLIAQGVPGLELFRLQTSIDVSSDGRVIIGRGRDSANQMGFFMARLASDCYPDCNSDGVLNLSDFGCFQTRFALGSGYADCNGDQVLNLSDFGCFQTKFALGCP